MDTGYNTIMDTVYEKYGPYIKLTWTDIPLNQLGECLEFEVFARISDTKIISAYYCNGPYIKNLQNPTLTFEEGFYHLYFDATHCSGKRMVEIVDKIEKIERTSSSSPSWSAESSVPSPFCPTFASCRLPQPKHLPKQE